MKYFKIVRSADLYLCKSGRHFELIEGALYTPAEFRPIDRKFELEFNNDYIVIDIPKENTTFIRGIRKEIN